MKKIIKQGKEKASAGYKATPTPSTKTAETQAKDQLKPTGIKVDEARGHQTLRSGFFQTRHSEKK